MKVNIYSHNEVIMPIEKAVVEISSIEKMYSFGVYENLKIRNNICYFIDNHTDRLFRSASKIRLIHNYSIERVKKAVINLTDQIEEESYNLKILLLGGVDAEEVQLIILPVAPFYPLKTWYRDGVKVMSFKYERWMPNVKSLNMLPSYYYYSQAKKKNCYDALFIDKDGNVREGSRTNFYAMKGNMIYSPPKKDVLEGVTMMTIERMIKKYDYEISYEPIPFSTLEMFDSLFLSSTSTKIIPIRKVDESDFKIKDPLIILIRTYNESLTRSKGILNNI